MTEDKMQLTEWLDDLCVRFIINLPIEELSSAARICFQIEEAQWFYEDFVRPLDPTFPSLNLRSFSAVMFQHCPLLQEYTAEDQERAFKAFLEYKTMVPVRGAILLNENMDEIVLVKGWKKGANWSFPRGKIDQNEPDLTCAIREVYEETGYDLKEAGLVGNEEEMKSINIQIRGQDLKMYIFRGVPMDTNFLPRTRKEISKVQWHRLAELPTLKSKKQQREGHIEDLAGNANKFYMVAPFLPQLKKWISSQRRQDKPARGSRAKPLLYIDAVEAENTVSDQEAIEEQVKDGQTEQNHLTRLLHTLRQSSQAVSSDLPEVSHEVDAQLGATEEKPLKSADLKAVLFGNRHQMPQTPLEQVVQEPGFPRSPLRHHPHHISDLPAPPTFPIQTGRPYKTEQASALLTPGNVFTPMSGPQLRPIPPPTQPAKLAPRPSMPDTTSSIMHKVFPSQKMQRPDTQATSLVREHQPFAAPPASQLPTPNPDPQKAALLNLFKSQPTAKPLEPNGTMPNTSSSMVGSKGSISTVTPPMFVPPQISKGSSEKSLQPQRTTSTHQAKLLDMFRKPSTGNVSKSLEPPEPAVELSASPMGTRSRNASNVAADSQSARPPSKGATLGQVKIHKRPQRDQAPVSATVTGPLNIPQFDMIRSASQEKRESEGSKEAVKVSPIQILSRPTSSHAQVSSPSQNSAVLVSVQPSRHQALPATITTPSKLPQPPTPDLKASDAHPKPFQPQILRRPEISQHTNEPSPIQPLPSPQHKSIRARDATIPNDHKKSLLSLFTKPSPVVPPPSAAPTKPEDMSGIISPLEKSATPPQRQTGNLLSDMFAPVSIGAALKSPATMAAPAKPAKNFHAPDRMPPHLSWSNTNKNSEVDGIQSGLKNGRHTSNASQTSTMTPANQEYLLGFLKGLK